MHFSCNPSCTVTGYYKNPFIVCTFFHIYPVCLLIMFVDSETAHNSLAFYLSWDHSEYCSFLGIETYLSLQNKSDM